MYLYEQIEQAKNFGAYKELPKYIPDNLNPSFELRPYQKDAFCNFITYLKMKHFVESQHRHFFIWQPVVEKR